VISDSMNLAQTQRNVVVLGASGIFSSQTYGKKMLHSMSLPSTTQFSGT